MPDVLTRYGRLTVPDADSDIIGRFLTRYGEWAWCEAIFVASTLQDGARVLDVGAFAGTFGLGVAMLRPLSLLCFVEANRDMARLLEGNVASKTQCPAIVIEAMVCGPNAQPRPGRRDPGNLGSVSFALGVQDGTVPPARRAMTLAEIRAEHGDFDLIKLDVEGMELEVLEGDAEHLSKGNSVLWVECNEEAGSLEVARLLLSWKLDLFYFAFPSFNPDNFNGHPEAVFPLAFEAGLLAAPRSRPSLTMDLQVYGCILKPIRSVDDLIEALWHTPRWGMPEWERAANRQELAALAGRALRGERFESFLQAGAGKPDLTAVEFPARLLASGRAPQDADALLQQERQARQTLESALHDANALSVQRLEAMAAEQGLRGEAQAALVCAEHVSLERLAALEHERESLREALQALRDANALSEERLALLAAERRRLEELTVRLASTEVRADVSDAHAKSLERELGRTNVRSLSHLAKIGVLRERLAAIQQDLDRTRADAATETATAQAGFDCALQAQADRAFAAEQALEITRSSSIWRISAPLRALGGNRPVLRALSRHARSAARLALGRGRR